MTIHPLYAGVLLWLMAVTLPAPVVADELGRLFTTPSERLALDRARPNFGRTAFPLPAAIAEGPASAPTQTPTAAVQKTPSPSALTYRGVVRRGDGRVWVWLGNDAPQDSRDLKRYDPTAAGLLRVPTRYGMVLLKPGQQLDFSSAVIKEGVSAGAGAQTPATGGVP